MEKVNIRFYILMRVKLGFDSTSIHADFISVLGNHAPSYSTVATIERCDRFEPKTMISILFRRSGVDQITYWDRGATITSESYTENYLKPLVWTIKKQRPTLGAKMLKFHQDNARLMLLNRS